MIDRDTTIRLAREVGAVSEVIAMGRHSGILFTPHELEHFAALVAAEVGIAQWHRGYAEGQSVEREQCAAHYLDIMRKAIEEEREQCAKVCDSRRIITPGWQLDQHYNQAASHCASAIRARGQQ